MRYEQLADIEEQGIDLKKWFGIFKRNWPFFLISIVITLTFAGLMITFSNPEYLVQARVLVNQENDPLDKSDLFAQAIYNDPYQLENEIGILKSKSVTRRAIHQLDFTTSYYREGYFRSDELFENSPFTILVDTSHLQPLGVSFQVNFISDTLFAISAEADETILYDYSTGQVKENLSEFFYEDTLRFGEITGNKYCRFTMLPGNGFNKGKVLREDYYFRFHSYQGLVRAFRGFKVENERSSSILTLTFQHENPAKAANFLNKVVEIYLTKGVERDNKIARATIRFIDAQLSEIVDSLELSGSELENFKSANQVLDIGFQAEKVYSKIEGLEAEKARLLVQKRYFSYLLENLRSKTDVSDLIAPSSLEINDQVLNNLIIELADLYSEKAEMSFNSIKDNPYLRTLEMRIDETRRKLIDAANNVLQTNDIAIEEIEGQIALAEQKLNRLPRDQQTLINIERKFRLNDELYTYLLTRRSEMEIFHASNLPANEVIDKAEAEDAVKVSPNIRLVVLMAVILGLLFPGLILYLKEILNNRIRNREDIRRLTAHPLLGQVIDSRSEDFPAVLSQPNSVLTESYRTLRTNLQFVIDESVSNTILVSSAVQGEGKSFTAMNLASVYAFYGKKTILLDFDLRKSCIQKNLGLTNEKGLSNYLSRNAKLDEVICQSDKLNFDLICAGPVPPNPSELISSKETARLIRELKKKYDIILIDSPPLGIVSDAMLLYSLIDITLLVVRYNYTRTEIFEDVIEDLESRKFERINIVLNDVNPVRSGYGYGYGYGYAYGHKKNDRKLFWQRN